MIIDDDDMKVDIDANKDAQDYWESWESSETCTRCGAIFEPTEVDFSVQDIGTLMDEELDPLYERICQGDTQGAVCPACMKKLEVSYISHASPEDLLLLVNYHWLTDAGEALYKKRLSGA